MKLTTLFLIITLILTLNINNVKDQPDDFILSSQTVSSDNNTIVIIYLQSPIDTTLQAYDIYWQIDKDIQPTSVICGGKYLPNHIQLIGNPDRYIDFITCQRRIIAILIFDGEVQFTLDERSNIAIAHTPESPKITIKNNIQSEV